MKSKQLVSALKLGVIALCLYLLSRKLDWQQVREALVMAHPGYFLPALVMILLEPVVMAQKWNLLLRHKGIHAGFGNLVRLIFTSNFLSVFLATSLGADAARVFLLTRQKHNLTHSTASLLADRLLGLAAIALLSLAGIAVAGDRLPEGVGVRAILVICVTALGGVAALMSPLPMVFLRLAGRLLPAAPADAPRWRRFISRGLTLVGDMHASLCAYLATPRLLAAVFGWNVVMQVLRTLQVHCIFHVLGVSLPLALEFVFVPIIVLLTLLPVSYFGMGVKESAFVYFFSALGVPGPVALSVSILTYPLIVVGLLPGGLFLLLPPPAPNTNKPTP